MARYVAKNLVASGLVNACEIQVSYAIGIDEPVSIYISTGYDNLGLYNDLDNKLIDIIKKKFDFRPGAIIERFGLNRPIFKQVSNYGHFGRNDLDLPWEKLDKVDDLKKYL